jgi:16S rRNA processing protein RimM
MTTKSKALPAEERILVAEIISPHGVKGLVTAISYSDHPERFQPGAAFLTADNAQLLLQTASSHQGRLLLGFAGVEDRNAAELLRKTKLYVEQALPLPEHVYYHFQLLGLEVRQNNQRLGVISDIISLPANDVYVVRLDQGGDLLLPALKQVVQEVNLDQAYMEVQVPEGL